MIFDNTYPYVKQSRINFLNLFEFHYYYIYIKLYCDKMCSYKYISDYITNRE